MDTLNILLSTGMSEYDAKRHIKDGVTVYQVDEFLANFDAYTEDYEDEDKAELRAFLEDGKDGRYGDNDLTTYEGVQYYIEYCL